MNKNTTMRVCALLLMLLIVCAAFPAAALADDQITVRVGWFFQPGYQEFDDNGDPWGYNYEFLLNLAERTGWNLEFVTKNTAGAALTWDDSLAMLASGDLDLMGCLLYTEERTAQYDFSALAAGQAFTSLFVRDDSTITDSNFSRLNGISVAANTATLNDEDLTAFSKVSGFTIGGYRIAAAFRT